MTRQDSLEVLSGAAARIRVLGILARLRTTLAMSGDPP